jgi:hypothetical protein
VILEYAVDSQAVIQQSYDQTFPLYVYPWQLLFDFFASLGDINVNFLEMNWKALDNVGQLIVSLNDEFRNRCWGPFAESKSGMQPVVNCGNLCHDDMVLNRAWPFITCSIGADETVSELSIADVSREPTIEIDVTDAWRTKRNGKPFANHKRPPEPSARLLLEHALADILLVTSKIELLRNLNCYSL